MERSFPVRDLALAGLLTGLVLTGCTTTGNAPGPVVSAGPSPQVAAPPAQAEDFTTWLTRFRKEAADAGISPATLDRTLTGIQPLPNVLAAESSQPEFTRPVWAYLDSAVSDTRVSRGRDALGTNAALLRTAEARHGVPATIIAAIWGMESSFGQILGDTPIIPALATLGHAGRRPQFGREQLLAALRLVDRGDVAPEQMIGSWAGAMGHTQFVPTTYERYAVDEDGDGRRDLFASLPDVFASTANYLAASGWKRGLPWGQEVALSQGFDYAQADSSVTRPVAEWLAMGVRPVGSTEIDRSASASVLLPAGHQGPAFLTTDNFRTILRYNNSTNYALAVSLLSDRLAGKEPVRGAWPRHERPLSRDERIELQRLLATRGLLNGAPDGIIGPMTRTALRRFQQEIGVPADGFATAALLERLRAATSGS